MSENQRLSNNGSVEEFYTAPDEYEKTTTASKQLPPSFNAPDLPPTTPVRIYGQEAYGQEARRDGGRRGSQRSGDLHTADELMTLYSSDSHMTDFLQLIQNLPVYPVIADKNGLISLVPVVDAEPMKISIETKSLMIIVTSVDKENGIRILNNVLAAISIRIEKPLVVEPVLIEYEKFEEPRALELSPPLSYRKMTVTTPEINTKIGLNLQDEEMANLLNNMSLKAEVASKEVLEVMIPPTRHDILHACDISEDVGVVCAYKNFLRDLSKEPPNITNFNRISSTLSKLLELDETNPDSVFSRKHSSELKKVTAKVLTLMKGEVKRAEKNLLMIQSKVGLEMSDSETEKAADEQSVEKKRNSSSQNPMES
uniref:B5 domain-containing protein n=1 Tax=Caenorhabditis tropicalis TaxID=1561998 RepID=A0A1I7U2C5_9PELO